MIAQNQEFVNAIFDHRASQPLLLRYVVMRTAEKDALILPIEGNVAVVAAFLCGFGGGDTFLDAALRIQDALFRDVLHQTDAELALKGMHDPRAAHVKLRRKRGGGDLLPRVGVNVAENGVKGIVLADRRDGFGGGQHIEEKQ